MLRGVNDSEAEARELVRLIAGIPAKVNLIPFNPWPGSAYEPSTREQLARFAAIVQDAGFASPIRAPRGRDILAACGQLRTESRRDPARLEPRHAAHLLDHGADREDPLPRAGSPPDQAAARDRRPERA